MASPHPAAPVPSVPASVVPSGIVYAFQFTAVAVWVAYAALYFQSLGVSLATIGLLASIPSAVAILAAPAWGLIADRLGDVRPPYLAGSLWAATFGLILATGPAMPWLVLVVGLLAVGTSGLTPLVDARTIQRLWPDRSRYGRARVWGSVSFMVTTVAIGLAVPTLGLASAFVVYALALLLGGFSAMLLLGRAARGLRVAGIGPLAGVGLLRLPGLGLFFVASTLAWVANSIGLTLLSLRVIDLGGDTGLVGIAWAVNAAVEIPLMILFPRIANRFRVEWLIVGGMGFIVLRGVLWWLAAEPATFVAVTVLSGFSFTLMLVGTTSYVAIRVPATLRATAQALFTSTTFAIGSIGGAIIAGQVAQAAGLGAVYPVSAAIALAGAVLAWWSIARPHALTAARASAAAVARRDRGEPSPVRPDAA
jgi:PPP family 3-phenylpropionic acid transporter